jgi:hypothetical protein
MGTLLSERLAILGVINPADLATSAASTGWVDVKNYNRLVALVIGGALTGTLDAKLQQATDSSGTGAKDITGKAITQLAATADNKQAIINIRQDQLDLAGGFDHVRLTLTPTGGTTNLASGLLLGGDARYSPPSNAASVVQTVN